MYVIIAAIIILLFVEYYRLSKMIQIERDLVKTQASLLLDDILLVELKQSAMERFDLLEKENLLMRGEGFGGSFDNKTITVYIVFPESIKFVWVFETIEEWYEYSKERYGRYNISGINLARMDSVYKTVLASNEITMPYVLGIRDSTDTIKEQIPQDIDYNRYQFALDDIRLDVGGKDYLIAHFDDSHFGLFRQSRQMLFVSMGFALLIIIILAYLLNTVFYQKRMAEEKEKFSWGIVHDLRKPVEYIRQALSTIKSEDMALFINLREIEYENENSSVMIENLLTTSIADKKQYVQKESVSIFEFISEIVDRYKIHNEEKNIRFLCDDISITAGIDRFHFGHVMMNLIDNAMKYSCENPDICVSCCQKDHYIHVSVKDNGIGIPKQYIRHIFKKHYRVPKRQSVPAKGFGLGLYYVKVIVEKHGGEVFVESEYQKGSEFTIIIPAES